MAKVDSKDINIGGLKLRLVESNRRSVTVPDVGIGGSFLRKECERHLVLVFGTITFAIGLLLCLAVVFRLLHVEGERVAGPLDLEVGLGL